MFARTLTTVLALVLAAACKSPAPPSPETQAIVDSTAKAHPDVVRLTVHSRMAGSDDLTAVASTAAEKLGKRSDKEDYDAVAKGDVVVVDEPGAIDVTVPILQRDGRWTAAAGVTLKADPAKSREQAIARAKEIAKAVEAAMAKGGS